MKLLQILDKWIGLFFLLVSFHSYKYVVPPFGRCCTWVVDCNKENKHKMSSASIFIPACVTSRFRTLIVTLYIVHRSQGTHGLYTLCARFVPVVITTKVQIAGVGLCYHRYLATLHTPISWSSGRCDALTIVNVRPLYGSCAVENLLHVCSD